MPVYHFIYRYFANIVSVYCNGDEMTPARKITLTHRLMQSWETILGEINRYINPQNTATRLYAYACRRFHRVVWCLSVCLSVCSILLKLKLTHQVEARNAASARFDPSV